MKRRCEFCGHYQCEEVRDSDLGAIYANEPTCEKLHDCDDCENLILNFSRDVQRECCTLDFWKVLDTDKELDELFIKETNFDKVYERFSEKYMKR